MAPAPRFDAFLSYSHAADAHCAAALQAALQRIGKRWYRRSKVKVFRDQTSLAAAPGLWAEIERHLADARWFVLLASPQAAASVWVGREVRWWLANRPAEQVLLALTGGSLAWDAAARRFDAERSPSLPADLLGAWSAEPLWVDMRWAAAEPRLNLRHGRFRDAALTFAARLHGRPKDELDSAEIREHRRFVTAAWSAGAAVNVLLIAVAVAWMQAREQQHRAEDNWRQAQARRLAAMAIEQLAGGDFDEAAQFAVLAWRFDDGGPAGEALRQVVASGPGVSGALGQHVGGVSALAFSGDGRLLVSGGRDGSLMRWRSADWQREGDVLPSPDAAASAADRKVDGLRADATGEHVFAWKRQGSGWWWQPRGGRVQRLDLHLVDGDLLHGAAIDTVGQRVLLVTTKQVAVWQPATGARRELRLPAWASRAVGACFTADGQVRVLATTWQTLRYNAEQGLRVFDWLPEGGRVREGAIGGEGLRAARQIYREPAWSADCRQLVMWDGDQPTVWAVDATLTLHRQALLATPALADPHSDGDVAAWFVDQRAVVAAYDDSFQRTRARIGSWRAGEPTSPPAAVLPSAELPMAGSADGRWLAAAGGGSLLLWDANAGAWGTPAARRLAVACNDASEQCAALLCRAVGKRFDEARLRKLFGIANHEFFYDTYRRVVDAAACPADPRPDDQRRLVPSAQVGS